MARAVIKSPLDDSIAQRLSQVGLDQISPDHGGQRFFQSLWYSAGGASSAMPISHHLPGLSTGGIPATAAGNMSAI
jgi:hypothetical protein